MDVEVVVRPPDELARWFVADLEREIRAALSDPGRKRPFTLAVPGGSVAEAFFPLLATAAIDWSRVAVFWVDERAVPPASPESNYGLAERLWLGPASVPASSVHRMEAEAADIGRAAEDYAAELEEAAGSPPVLDYVLLGVGTDGHVASVFPGARVDPSSESATWTDHAPKPPSRRMTLSLRTLSRARRVVVAAFDASKRTVMRAALEDPAAETPVAQVLRMAANGVVLLVDEAGP